MRYLLFLVFIAHQAVAQSGYGTSSAFTDPARVRRPDTVRFLLPAGQFWHTQAWKDSVYLFPQFMESRFEFSNGFVPETRVYANYNAFLESIDVRRDNGEIGQLKRLPELRVILIGDRRFVYKKGVGYLHVVEEGFASVAVKPIMAMSFQTSTGFSDATTSFDERTLVHKLPRYYSPVEALYILGNKGKLYRVGTNTLPSIFPDMKQEIRAFTRDKQIDLRKKKDLITLVKYCNEQHAMKNRDKVEPR